MNFRDRLFSQRVWEAPDAAGAAAPAPTVSPAGTPPAAPGESAGATVSAAVAPAAIPAAAVPAEPPAFVPAKAAEPAHDFKPSILELEGSKPADAAVETPKSAEALAADAPKPDGKATVDSPKPAELPASDKPADPAPIAYEFRFPENADPKSVDKPALDKYTSILNKAHVPADAAQEALDLHLEQIQATAKRLATHQWDVFNRQQESWQDKVRADPELGGSRIRTVMRTAASFIEKFGGSPAQQKAIMDVMRTTGAGNHPEVLRLFYRAGDLLAREPEARNMPPARQVPITREQKQMARYK